MTEPATPSPHSFVPPRLPHSADSGDGWVEDGTGQKFWGRFGAAGLLAHDPARGILLQHRANWSHFGGTWGLPSGARHAEETPVQGAVREASEEAGIVVESLRLRMTSTLDLGFWSYTTVVVDVTEPFDAMVTDAESIDVRWVAVDEVAALPLHPGFGASWPVLRTALEQPIVLVVDSANVVGSRPDGWWKDRAGATTRLAGRLAALGGRGVSAATLGFDGDDLAGTHWWPEIVLVTEGAARGALLPEVGARDTATADLAGHVTLVRAEKDGDQAIVDAVEGIVTGATTGAPPRIFVVTADRELSSRVTALGATVLTPSWLLTLLDGA